MSTLLENRTAITIAGIIRIGSKQFGIVVAPKAEGEKIGAWHSEYTDVIGARSFFDGLANTDAMAEAGSDLAQWARGLTIDGQSDWYIPSRDELELMYRSLKPSTQSNFRLSGDNPSSVPPGYPYSEDLPAQTAIDAFRSGSVDALAPEWYWSSTQFSRGSAWGQGFDIGIQGFSDKSWKARCRVVRRFAIE